jgi:hypothetical protein
MTQIRVLVREKGQNIPLLTVPLKTSCSLHKPACPSLVTYIQSNPVSDVIHESIVDKIKKVKKYLRKKRLGPENLP